MSRACSTWPERSRRTQSVADPLHYAHENVGGVVSLLGAVRRAGCTRVVFSSSCSVYGTPTTATVDEDAPKNPESPYGDSKLYGERLLTAAGRAYGLGVLSLRYFNVVGAANPALVDTGAYNLVPVVVQALREGRRPQVFGDDYATPDGTCVRDYVDVRDVAEAHVAAAQALEQRPRVAAYNVGRGEGSSVLQVLDLLREVTGLAFEHEVLPRRPGDPAAVVGRVDRIAAELGWSARWDCPRPWPRRGGRRAPAGPVAPRCERDPSGVARERPRRSARTVAAALWRSRDLVRFFVLRDLRVRYKQAVLGVLWVLLQPVATVVIFTLVFSRLARIGSEGVPYPLFALAGMVVWSYFSGAVSRGWESLVSNPELVTKVYLPAGGRPGRRGAPPAGRPGRLAGPARRPDGRLPAPAGLARAGHPALARPVRPGGLRRELWLSAP